MDCTVTDSSTFIDEMVQEVKDELSHPVNDGKVCVVVEGEDDIGLYGKFLNENLMFFYPTGNCIYILPIIDGLSTFSNRLIGIKDADFDHLRGVSYAEPNLFLTDCHDCETMMLKTAAVEDLIYEYTHQRLPNIVNDVFKALEWYSYLQYYNTVKIVAVNNDGIRFKGLNMDKIYNGIDVISCSACLNSVREHGNNSALSYFPSEEELQTFRNQNSITDFYNLHRGHDVMHCMAIVIRRNAFHKKIGNSDVARALRISYQFEDFQSTILYRKLDAWMTNTGHHIWN